MASTLKSVKFATSLAAEPDRVKDDIAKTPALQPAAIRKGASVVAGKVIWFKVMLEGFFPTTFETIHEDVKKIEMIPAMLRPVGCVNVPSSWVAFRNYQKIIEMRDGMRMNKLGMTLGDRDFRRMQQEAHRLIADKALTPAETAKIIESSFRDILDQPWHRYMFPFGGYAYQVGTAGSKADRRFREDLTMGTVNTDLGMNPYSVTGADILYLCDTCGYMRRFINLAQMIIDIQDAGNYNLLQHRRFRGREPKPLTFLDRFYTLEKHLFFVGSIWFHHHVLSMYNGNVGNWREVVQELEHLYTQAKSLFRFNCYLDMESKFELLNITNFNGNATSIHCFFKQAIFPYDTSRTA